MDFLVYKQQKERERLWTATK